jgi:hypothetical protein
MPIAARASLVRVLAGCKIGNDPHDLKIPQSMLEDVAKSCRPHRGGVGVALGAGSDRSRRGVNGRLNPLSSLAAG